MISVRNISKAFGRVRAVQNISFDVAPGQVIGLLGANGAGKTTTIRMATGFIPPDSGRIQIAGHDTLQDSENARRAIGYLPEAAPAYGEMATQDYLDFRARLYSMPRRARRAAIEAALDRCELQEVRRRRIGQLSRGFRQRVGLAAAILHDPPVLILDEPTSALDPRQIRQIRALIRDLAQAKGGRAVLVSSHILPEVEQTCDRIIIMARGQVRIDARPQDLLDSVRDAAPYIVECKATAERAIAILSSVAGIKRIVPDESGGDADAAWSRFRLWSSPGACDLREAIAAAAAESGLLLRELRRESPTLEQIFLQMIEAEEPVAQPAAPSSRPPDDTEPAAPGAPLQEISV